jgi:hypothetical protein
MRSRVQREEEQNWAQELRGPRRRIGVAGAGNLALLVLLVGLPYARGVMRAKEAIRGYAGAVSCLLGRPAASPPGIAPVDHLEASFGRQAMRFVEGKDAGWLERCDRALAAVVPEPAVFVWPYAKEGEHKLREAVRVVRSTLRPLRHARVAGRIPHDPVRALVQLRDVLQEHASGAGVLDLPLQATLQPSAFKALPTIPTRVPIYAGADAVVNLWGDDSVLHAVAVDRTGLSYVKAERGEFMAARHVRPKLLQGFARHGSRSYLLYALPHERCEARQGGCASKAMGVASVSIPLKELPPPRWIAAHPSARLDLSVSFVPEAEPFEPLTWARAESVWRLAAENAAQSGPREDVRSFVLSEPAGGNRATELPPLPWSASAAAVGEPLRFFTGNSSMASVSVKLTGEQLQFERLQWAGAHAAPQGEPTVLGSLPSDGQAWVTGCQGDGPMGFDGASGLAFGTAKSLLLHQPGAQPAFEPVPMELGTVLHEKDPARDRVIRLCVPERAIALARDSQDRLFRIVCTPGVAQCEKALIAEHVAGFAAIDSGANLIVAYAGREGDAQVRVQRLDRTGRPVGSATIPSPCWEPARPLGGLCDQPALHKVGTRIVLSARDDTDLLALESGDHGTSWQGLGGFL